MVLSGTTDLYPVPIEIPTGEGMSLMASGSITPYVIDGKQAPYRAEVVSICVGDQQGAVHLLPAWMC